MCCQLLLESGANGSARMVQNDTPAHRAAEIGDRKILLTILLHGGSLVSKNDHGQLPSDIATIYGHTECAELLKR